MPYLRECDPLTGEVIRASKTTAFRYEHDRPGSLVHMDVKKVGRIPDGGGWKAHSRQMGRTSVQKCGSPRIVEGFSMRLPGRGPLCPRS